MDNFSNNKMVEKFFKLMQSMAKNPQCAAIAGQLWSQYNKNNNLFNESYIRLERCDCFDADILYVFSELGYEVLKTIPIPNSSAVYVVLNKYS